MNLQLRYLLPYLVLSCFIFMGCGLDEDDNTGASGAPSGACGTFPDMCGIANGVNYGDCCSGSLCRAEPNQRPYSFCAPICRRSSECSTGCCAPMAGSGTMVCQAIQYCGTGSGPCGGRCGANEFCDRSTNRCECPSQCLDAVSGTCCGGNLCSGACIGNSCCR